MKNELEIGKRTRFVQITQVKLGDNLGSMSEFSSRNPRSFFIGTLISRPPD